MSTVPINPAFFGHDRGRIDTLAAVCLAAAVLIGIGAALAVSKQRPVTEVLPSVAAAAAVAAFPPPSHALPISEHAETYSESNPQPVAF
ncbi:MAG: hypothetical protein ABI831_13060 [Betaproteobacteria bacterium]